VLMVAFLALFGGLSIHQAAATSLFTFLFTGLLGTWLYQRRGSIDWRIAVPVCAGALIFGYLGAAVAARIDARPLSVVIALIIAAAGVYIFIPQHSSADHRSGCGWREQRLLACVCHARGYRAGFSDDLDHAVRIPMSLSPGYVS